MAVISLLFLSFLLSLSATSSALRCGDEQGGYCAADEECCFSPGGELLEYCCSEERPKCCGDSANNAVCCEVNKQCVRNCIDDSYRCEASSGESSPTSCTQQCCGNDCCPSCCGGLCTAAGTTCCAEQTNKRSQPASFSLTSNCPENFPFCCPSISGGDSSAMCCHAESNCCEGCENSEQCCGGCSCCSITSYCSIESKSCVEKSFSWLIKLMLMSWYISIAVTVISLSWKLTSNPILTPLHTYYEVGADPNICEVCGHLHHSHKCDIITHNYERDCQTCLDGCRRGGCHKRDHVCSKGFMSKQEFTRNRRPGRSSYDSVVVQSINSVCSCQGCTCMNCVRYFDCSCTNCSCRYCRGLLANIPRWALFPLLDGIYLFLISIVCYLLFPSARYLTLAMFAMSYSVLWLAAIYFLVRLPTKEGRIPF